MRRIMLAAAALPVLACLPAAAQRPIPLDTLHATAGTRLYGPAAARTVEVVDRRAIEALPAGSVMDVLARVLGADVQRRSAAQADLSIRGAGFEQVLVLVDGVPVNDDQTGHFHLDLAVPLDAVERIEVLRGPASAVYGTAAVGGVVNIVTRGARPALGARLQGGSFGAAAGALDAGGRRGAAGARVSAEHDRADGHRPGTEHRITQLHAAADAPLAGGRLRGSAGYALRDFGANAFYAPFDSREETRTVTAALAWESGPGAFTVAPRVSFREHEDDFVLRRDDPAFYRNRHTGRQAAVELVARWRAGGVAAAVGGDAALSALRSASLGDRDEDRVAAFAEVVAGDVARRLLSVGLRADRHSSVGAFVSPSAAASMALADGLRLRASGARGFRAPNWTERYYRDPANIGSEDLDAEKFWTAELGLAWTARRARGDIAGFVRRATGLIDWARPSSSSAGADSPNPPWRTMNVERATFRGVESSVEAGLGSALLRAEAAALAVDGGIDPLFASKYALRPLTRTAALQLRLPLGQGVDAAVRGSHARRDDDSWNLLDARLSFRRSGVHIFADATNLAGEKYTDIIGQPAPGRALALGLRLSR